MKQLFYISLLLLAFAACKTTKSTSTTVEKKADTTVHKDSVGTAKAKETNTYHEKKDSAVKVPERDASTSLTPQQLQPAYQKDGTPIEREHRFDNTGVHGTVKVNPDGSVKIDCKCDSLQFIVTQMERTITDSKEAVDYWHEQYNQATHTESLKSNSETVITKKSWLDQITEKAGLLLLLYFLIKGIINIGKNIIKRYKNFY